MVAWGAWIPPERFAEYRVLRKLGAGGMGNVYLALDELLDRQVAVKFISSRELSAVQRERLLREARAAARLQHPNVVAVHRVGELQGRPYIVCEFVRGQSLDQLEMPMPWPRVIELGIGLARGLVAAHEKGVLHRDIKPANAILTADGEVKLIDFGLAKLIESNLDASDLPPPNDSPNHRNGDSTLPTLSSAPDTIPGEREDDSGDMPIGGPGEATRSTKDSDQKKLTKPGGLLGTPYYLAPELWAGGAATVRSDIYALGSLLYELAVGRPPYYGEGPKMEGLARLAFRVASTDPLSLLEAAPDVDARLASLVDRCLARDPSRRFASSDELLEALLEARPGVVTHEMVPKGNPYRGLHPFAAEHRALFFGRRLEVSTVVERLRRERFILVTGDSGAGKSSLCRAGVLPHIIHELQYLPEWSIAEMVPGRRPMSALRSALSSYLPATLDELSGEGLATLLDDRSRDGSGLVLFVDQLEELVSIADRDQANECARALGIIACAPGARLLATARSDFLTRLAGLPGLGNEITRAVYVLKPMTAESAQEAIVGPAETLGFRFEDPVDVDRLVSSTPPGGLPLLQFALAEIWELRDVARSVIPRSALEAIGGVEGALAGHADRVLEELLPEDRKRARSILMRLVTSEGTRATQTQAALLGVAPGAAAVLDALVRGRIVVARAHEDEPTYELAHEALIRSWGTLDAWLRSTHEERLVKDRLARAASEWLRLEDEEMLFGEKQLLELRSIDLGDLGALERDFVERSRRRLKRKRLVRWGAIAGAIAFAALISLAATIQARLETDRSVLARLGTAKAMLDRVRSGNVEVARLRSMAFARFDAGDLAGGELVWSGARAEAAAVTSSLAKARRELEASLAIDATRSDVRDMLVAAELLRAEIAERDHVRDVFEDALARIAEWDRTPSALVAWNRPAHLRIATHPVGARVTIGRYQQRPHEHWPLEDMRSLGETPIEILTLAPGSYLLSLEADGFAPVRYPIVVARAESKALDIRLLEANRVPQGFVYLPEGDFLFGSAADDAFRRTFDKTVPIHRTKTGAFLIAKHETTNADWIAFLEGTGQKESLGPWPLGLRRLPGGWALGVSAAELGRPAVLRWGEVVRVGGRELDWSRWPIRNIMRSDVEAYVRWLRATGRVARARLCKELEWERAARGADARLYPHGDRLDPEDANFYESSSLHPRHAVGSHPASRSPFGIDDAAGNAWEMIDRLDPSRTHVISRGGASFSEGTYLSVVLRVEDEATFRLNGVGLRICADIAD